MSSQSCFFLFITMPIYISFFSVPESKLPPTFFSNQNPQTIPQTSRDVSAVLQSPTWLLIWVTINKNRETMGSDCLRAMVSWKSKDLSTVRYISPAWPFLFTKTPDQMQSLQGGVIILVMDMLAQINYLEDPSSDSTISKNTWRISHFSVGGLDTLVLGGLPLILGRGPGISRTLWFWLVPSFRTYFF